MDLTNKTDDELRVMARMYTRDEQRQQCSVTLNGYERECRKKVLKATKLNFGEWVRLELLKAKRAMEKGESK